MEDAYLADDRSYEGVFWNNGYIGDSDIVVVSKIHMIDRIKSNVWCDTSDNKKIINGFGFTVHFGTSSHTFRYYTLTAAKVARNDLIVQVHKYNSKGE